MGVSEHKMIVEGDAVSPQRFHHFPDTSIVRDIWNIPVDAYVLGYAGSFMTMGLTKGVEQIVLAAAKLRAEGGNIHVVLAGGPERDGRKLADAGDFIIYRGQLPQKEILMLYGAADLLIYPAPHTDHPYFLRDTSPLKIFEYMSTRKPMITADLPPVRDVLDEDAAYFYTPGSIEDLSSQIQAAIDTPAEAQAKADRAHALVQNHTWRKRMDRILSSLL
jgi:glycosyltransferase involved in cell wall biosynthesis